MSITRKKMKETTEEASSSVQTVASVDDLLVEILLRLPMKSLLRFKSVSKHWLSVIADPQFALRRNPNPNPALGLFLPCTAYCVNPKFEYICFDTRNPTTPPFKKLKFTKDPSGIHIVQSCNGLLLCASFRAPESKRNYYVYNPTRKQFTKLPKPRREPGPHKVIHGVALAFDPAKSPHYKVVCVRESEMDPSKYQIEIYSSDAGPWRASGGPFTANINFETAAYWNGAVHWFSAWGDIASLWFNVDDERLGVMPTPPIPDDWESGTRVTYFGESCDHLHLIQTYTPQIQFNVYEMKRDYSEWFVKYHVDLAAVAIAFPGMAGPFPGGDINYYAFSIFALIRGEKEGEAFLVLQTPGKAIRYNLVSKSFEKLCDFEGADDEHYLRFSEFILSHQHIESLCCV